MRRLSAQTVLFHYVVAERLGLNATDLQCVSILNETGTITAGELAKLTSLTTGAITGVVDRLEKAGLVKRIPNPADRRSVLLQSTAPQTDEVTPLFVPLQGAMIQLLEQYNAQELTTLLDMITQANSILKVETARLRQEPPAHR